MNLQELKNYYSGFWVKENVGNNAFSFDSRQQKEIYVPSLVEGNLQDVCLGRHPVFCEVVEGVERIKKGLKHFVYWKRGQQHIFVFDNHNHAFSFWMWGHSQGLIQKGSTLVHVDQHRDTRIPEKSFSLENFDLKQAFDYTHFDLNVGNFIPPAIDNGLFKNVEMVINENDLSKSFDDQIVLDIDLDFFAPEMDYISNDLKLKKIREYLQRSNFVTIATSPFFIDQLLAISYLKRIFKGV